MLSASLQPTGAPMPLTTTLLEVDRLKRFKDVTKMPFGSIEVTHDVKKTLEGTELTHSIEATIFEDKVAAFESTLWKKWQTGLSNSVNAIVSQIVEKKTDDSASTVEFKRPKMM